MKTEEWWVRELDGWEWKSEYEFSDSWMRFDLAWGVFIEWELGKKISFQIQNQLGIGVEDICKIMNLSRVINLL